MSQPGHSDGRIRRRAAAALVERHSKHLLVRFRVMINSEGQIVGRLANAEYVNGKSSVVHEGILPLEGRILGGSFTRTGL
jgi:hypothetical protein